MHVYTVHEFKLLIPRYTYIINTWSFIQDSLVGFIGNVVFVIIK